MIKKQSTNNNNTNNNNNSSTFLLLKRSTAKVDPKKSPVRSESKQSSTRDPQSYSSLQSISRRTPSQTKKLDQFDQYLKLQTNKTNNTYKSYISPVKKPVPISQSRCQTETSYSRPQTAIKQRTLSSRSNSKTPDIKVQGTKT